MARKTHMTVIAFDTYDRRAPASGGKPRARIEGFTLPEKSRILRATRAGEGAGAEMTPDQFKSQMIGMLPQLRRFALSLTRSGPDADDLLQDACAAALQKWQQYDPSQPMDRWMFRVIRNLWISELRKRKVRLGEGQVDAEEAQELHHDGGQQTALDAGTVRRTLADMDPDLAQPLLLVCAEGYSYREVADLLQVPIGTVMSRIHRARKMVVARMSAPESEAL